MLKTENSSWTFKFSHQNICCGGNIWIYFPWSKFFKIERLECNYYLYGLINIILIFQILWKCNFYLFISHLRKFHSIVRFLTQKVELWIFLLVILLMKRHHKIFFLSNFQCRKWIFVELVNRAKICHKNQSVTNFIKAGKNLLFKNALMPSIFWTKFSS